MRILRRTYAVNALPNPASSFTQEITNLTWQPDEVILRQVVFENGGAGAANFQINTDMLDRSSPIAIIYAGAAASGSERQSFTPSTVFKPDKDIKGTFNFFFISPFDGSLQDVDGGISLLFEFVKYIKE